MTTARHASAATVQSSGGQHPRETGPETIGGYLIQRLQDLGVRDVFGVPGDYVLSFYSLLDRSPINVIGCTREDSAGFAADAYARIRGLGVVCITYCVGGLSVCNSVAGAYAEKSPVVVISGSPGLSERVNNPLLHHKVRDFCTQFEVFQKLCVANAELSDPTTAIREVDRVLAAAQRYKRPVYIELPRDMVHVEATATQPVRSYEPRSDPQVLTEAVEESLALISRARRPMILAGVEIHRFGLQDLVLALAEKTGMPIAATILGKSVIRETHPLYIGLYEGAIGHEEVTRQVEQSDCLILLGTFMTDLNLGIYTAKLDPGRCIYATSEDLRIHYHHYRNVLLGDFISRLSARCSPSLAFADHPPRSWPEFQLQSDARITISRLIARLNEQLDRDTIVIADIGDALFAATELITRERTEFLSPAYYTSMGFSIPAALGAHVARPDCRVVAICGDGAFQMTGMELSTVIHYGYAPTVIILDNGGYGTERFLHPGNWQFNEIHGWNYHRLPEVLGGGCGYLVRTEGEFDAALNAAWGDRSGPSLIHVQLQRDDASQTLRRLAERLGRRV
jgi:indolepyruvate decarboxylase